MVELLFCGDIFLANTSFTKRIGLGANVCQLGVDERIDGLYDLAKNCDYVFCNLESPLTEDKEEAKNSSFLGYSNIPQLLINSKINIVSIANNHILDHGVDKFEETIKILERNGLFYVGKYENGMSNICIFEKNDIKIGYAAFNGVDLHKINNPDLFAELNESTVKLTLKRMTSLGVVVKILSFHWGDEYITIPSPQQIKLGHFAIDNGANIIVGHHPHVVQPIEYYKDGLIIYSLGNCIFDFLQSGQFRRGIIARVSIKENMKIEYEDLPIKLQDENYFYFDKHNKKIPDNEWLQSYNSDENEYYRFYKKVLRNRHLTERIKMKATLINKLVISNLSNKRILMKNIINYYFSKQ